MVSFFLQGYFNSHISSVSKQFRFPMYFFYTVLFVFFFFSFSSLNFTLNASISNLLIQQQHKLVSISGVLAVLSVVTILAANHTHETADVGKTVTKSIW